MQANFIEGLVKYPDDLPCPQADTDLVPRERRYISDISDVRNMRMFQQEFQATRNRIAFIFTEEEVRQFREWYEVEIISGGAWFYADWPTLHKDKKIAHRFVGQPKYEWLFGGNPGMMGRSSVGVKYAQAPMAVPMYKVTATVELYDPRKVGKAANVFTSKLYPILPIDDIKSEVIDAWSNPEIEPKDHISLDVAVFYAKMRRGKQGEYEFYDHIQQRLPLLSVAIREYIYSEYYYDERITSPLPTFGVVVSKWLITYDYYSEDVATSSVPTIVSGVMR